MDPRLAAADDWARLHRTLEAQIDDLTVRSRYARQWEQRLRREVAREREWARLQAEADRELERRPRKAKAA